MAKPSNYSNFRDPLGLALRMIRRGSREALWPLFQAASSFGTKWIDKYAAGWDKKFQTVDHSVPQILVVGLPRCGTTLVSQVLAQHLSVSYFPNVSAIFPSAPIWATQKFVGTFEKAPQSHNSLYGNTAGWQGINDGFHIWNRWLGENRYRIDKTPEAEDADSLRNFFGRWSAAFKLPLLNKNNRNVDGIELLANLLPNSYYVVVRRNPLLTIQSLLQAREFVQGARTAGWGLFADRFQDITDPLESVCRQVAYGRNRQAQQLEQLPEKRYVSIDYEEFCDNPGTVIHGLVSKIPNLTLRSAQQTDSIQPFKASTSLRLPQTETDQAQAILQEHTSSEYRQDPAQPLAQPKSQTRTQNANREA